MTSSPLKLIGTGKPHLLKLMQEKGSSTGKISCPNVQSRLAAAKGPYLVVRWIRFTKTHYPKLSSGNQPSMVCCPISQSSTRYTNRPVQYTAVRFAKIPTLKFLLKMSADITQQTQLLVGCGEGKIFYTTGRLTSEIVMKVAHMGIPILLSRSGITYMGLELAQDLRVTMIARAKGRHFLVYNGSDTVEYDQVPERRAAVANRQVAVG